ncbi:MAG: hypothetical protein ACO3N7_08425 [Kiritimatiellia bacterium]
MADKKRKTLQIKRPDPNSVKAKKKPLPKVQVDDKAATSAVDTDELASMGPQTLKKKSPGDDASSRKNNTTRIALPDEDKIRKARRANATQDLGAEGALPSAEQIAQAQKNATMPIMIDTETVEQSSKSSLNDTDEKESMDRTMEIDADALSTANLSEELKKADKAGDVQSDQTMQIDPEALSTSNLQETLKAADAGPKDERDQTMQIDPEALATGNLADALNEAGSSKTQNDQTLKIDANDLNEAAATQALDSEIAEDGSDKTMQIDPEALATGKIDQVNADPSIMSMETMKMDPEEVQDGLEAGDEDGTQLTVEEMKESFNAQTMEMDASVLADELAKKNTSQLEEDAPEGEDRSITMDLSESRPKTIMIKRPSKKAPTSSSTPTVKAVRPDAATVRASRPVTANTAQPKQDTSRIDIPGEAAGNKEGKTIKLRRPNSGAPSRSKSSLSRVTGSAGLSINEDGTVTAMARAPEQLGVSWLAVAVLTFLFSAAAVWSLAAQIKADLPMPGRLVDANNQIIASESL